MAAPIIKIEPLSPPPQLDYTPVRHTLVRQNQEDGGQNIQQRDSCYSVVKSEPDSHGYDGYTPVIHGSSKPIADTSTGPHSDRVLSNQIDRKVLHSIQPRSVLAQPRVSKASTFSSSKCSPQQQCFHEAVMDGDFYQVERLLERGDLNINSLDGDGQTALHRSCLTGNLDVVKLLVRFGADMRVCNRDGWSALHLACWSGHQPVTLYLLNAFRS